MLTSGGGSKSLTSLYGNVGGTRKSISSAYANINAAQKQIFPYSATYTWNKYNVETTRTPWLDTTPVTVFMPLAGQGNIYSVDSWKFVANGDAYEISITDYTHYGKVWYLSSLPSGYWITYLKTDHMYSGGWICEDTVLIDGEVEAIEIDYVTEHFANTSVSTSRGSYIGQVTSTNRSAYPDNSYSGSYWYVFVS